jgi:hypothetical protein
VVSGVLAQPASSIKGIAVSGRVRIFMVDLLGC